MRRIPPGWSTDLAILALTGSIVEPHHDHLVVRTPGNPNYHWGNCLLVTDPGAVSDAARWSDAFHAAFPEANWIAIGLPVLPDDVDPWSVSGMEIEQNDVLTTPTVPRASPLPAGYTARALVGDDWERVVDREIAVNARSGEYEETSHEAFVRATVRSRRELCERGLAAFFGSFEDQQLVADLGILRCGSTARFQAVGTDPDHRRRGLASHLLGVAAGWAAAQGCNKWVIVTESTNDAGRVYRRAGFALAAATVSAYQRPPLQPR
jgi:GNAT superfamily N-acetyltransferase